MDGLAIIGYSFKLPQGIEQDDDFWEVLTSGRNVMTEWPEDRTNIETFHDGGSKKHNTLYAKGGHFLRDDPAGFDAPFFSITAKEANSMDPTHRFALEVAYHAFENAGIPIEQLSGSQTAVLASTMTDDYTRFMCKDSDQYPPMAVTGSIGSILANRISWFYNIRGPSITLDTACSSCMVGLDMACQYIRSGDASSALVIGSNLMLGPECSISLANSGFLSEDSVCHSFDHRANGYARGEGVLGIVIKSVADALRDGDTIRAVIRSHGTNQDGHTPGLTQPSMEAQEAMIRHVYRKANLDFDSTMYVEAHGTGTALGDPIEAKSIGKVFRRSRSKDSPLVIGSVKSNIGHLEGASGLAGVLKSILILERGVIPPNALFEKLNPDIDAEFYHLHIPSSCVPWPSEKLRRISINSFGFGGTNSHVVLDDAYNYLRSRGLDGHHNCTASTRTNGFHDTNRIHAEGTVTPRLLAFSAADEGTLKRMIDNYRTFFTNHIHGNHVMLDRLAYTLAARRSRMAWRSFGIVNDDELHTNVSLSTVKPARTQTKRGLAFVFTGQGAQYAKMGLELMKYPVFRDALMAADKAFKDLGCEWSIIDALGDKERINQPDHSQPLCTALQIGLVQLLESFGVVPAAVVGHSSGEIAAAYTTGALDAASAYKAAYYRGLVAQKLKATTKTPGAMLSVNLPPTEAQDYLKSNAEKLGTALSVACLNSPTNCTVSGEESSIDQLKGCLDADQVVAQKLRTGVAYHSPAMREISAEYKELLRTLKPRETVHRVTFSSSVTGTLLAPSTASEPQYWIDNLVSPVRFSQAVAAMRVPPPKLDVIGTETITDFVEIGPHPALRRPLRDTLAQDGKTEPRQTFMLHRDRSDIETVLELVGQLFCQGYPVSVAAANGQEPTDGQPTPQILVNLPKYPFDNSRKYWSESRLSKDYRLREVPPNDVLGVRSHDWNPLEPRWRNFLGKETLPWLKDHVVTDTVLFPGTGMLVMCMEAVKQMASGNREIAGFFFKEAEFINPILITEDDTTETVLQLRPVLNSYEKEAAWFDISIMTYLGDQWRACFNARVQVQYQEAATEVERGTEKNLRSAEIIEMWETHLTDGNKRLDSKEFYSKLLEAGLAYGKTFQLLQDIRWDSSNISIARIDPAAAGPTNSLVHPAILDAAVHLAMTQVSEGLEKTTATLVPRALKNAFVSATGWSTASSVHIISDLRTYGGDLSSSHVATHILAEDGTVLCDWRSLSMTPVSREEDAKAQPSTLVHGVDWKPQLSLLSQKQLSEICRVDQFPEDSTGMRHFFPKLESGLDAIMRKTLAKLTAEERSNAPEHLQKLISWMERRAQATLPSDRNNMEEPELVQYLKGLAEERPSCRLYPEVGINLYSIIKQEVDPLEFVFKDGSAEAFYVEMFDRNCDDRMRSFLELAVHENPQMRILEVGAGTGSMTKHVLGHLKELEHKTGATLFAEYTYTDISPSYFGAAEEQFGNDVLDRIQFKVFDLELAAEKQGFQLESYDMIIAGSVLHATKDISATLENLRRCLKDGGHLLLLEVVVTDTVVANLGFGVLPGWWLAVEDWRQDGPCISERQWDKVLKENGFSGNDLVIEDYQYDVCKLTAVMVSTAAKRQRVDNTPIPTRSLWLITDGQSNRQTLMAGALKSSASAQSWNKVNILSVHSLETAGMHPKDVAVVLFELDEPFFYSISQANFTLIQSVVEKFQNLLWATLADPKEEEEGKYVQYSLSVGFVRGMRSEDIDKHYISLFIEQEDGADLLSYQKYIEAALRVSFEDEPASLELEYVVRNGNLETGRLFENIELNSKLRSAVSAEIHSEPWQPGPPLELQIGTVGLLNTFEYIQDLAYDTPLKPDEVEIEAKTWGLSFRDIFVALGRLPGQLFGADCAGIVTRAGPESGFVPGDRVAMICLGCMRSHPRTIASHVVKIPDQMSFEVATSIICPGLTAYHALLNVANLKKGEKILIHSGAGSTGQMAIWMAKLVGAEIFVTVGFDAKKEFLMQHFGIPEDHIFYSRNTTFAERVMRATGGKGVDVVLNSLSGDGLRASWECVAEWGRFIEIGKADIVGNSSLPMGGFARNVIFAAVDLYHLAISNPPLAGDILQKTVNLLASGQIHSPSPLATYPNTELESAFRYMQTGKNIGRIIIQLNPTDVVPKRIIRRPNTVLDPDASYLISGGLGGIGRSVLKWLAGKGAKTLIVPSRSAGAGNKAATAVLAELKASGVNVVTPLCDVSSLESVSAMLDECTATLPPIRGCINASMVLQDAVFANMQQAQWDTTIRSKAHTAWVLHKLLPKSLDFFILFSSLAGIYGSPAQSNYAAGCVFQDTIASYRARRGEKAVSLDIGWMRTIGIIAETEEYQRNRKNTADMNQIEEEEFLAMLDIHCDPSLPATPPEYSQILFGTVTPGELLAAGESFPSWGHLPVFAGYVKARNTGSQRGSDKEKVDVGALFRQAENPAKAAEIAENALVAKLARALSIATEDIDTGKFLSNYGVDSLMAVELRNWIGNELKASVAVFDIMGGTSIAAIGELIAARSEITRYGASKNHS
ncbi:unnamed protein product [Clonostachys rosea]|uniref:Carrier domain-containing protein n=1 Tax=Bionectria ochroleuca TaxID=29856 RepID=A0ABY6UPV5_BIOOC|nr:unnamed protein product [Clonostachys rosea]